MGFEISQINPHNPDESKFQFRIDAERLFWLGWIYYFLCYNDVSDPKLTADREPYNIYTILTESEPYILLQIEVCALF